MTIITRAQWGARSPKYTRGLREPVAYVVVHHEGANTVDPDATFAEECRILRSVQNYHMDTRDYRDIAYSFVIFPSGRVYEGRGWGIQGGHTSGTAPNGTPWNDGAYGVCAAGNYDKQAAKDSLLTSYSALIRFGEERGHIKPDATIIGHRDTATMGSGGTSTACPGKYLYAKLPAIRQGTEQGDDVALTPSEQKALDFFTAVYEDIQKLSPATGPSCLRTLVEDFRKRDGQAVQAHTHKVTGTTE